MINGKNFIYSALDEFVEVSGDTIPFALKRNGETVLEGVAREFPDGRQIRFYLNRLADAYLDTGSWEDLLFVTGVTKNTQAGANFQIINTDTNTEICSAYVIKGCGTATGVTSEPIDGKADPRMLVFYSSVVTEGNPDPPTPPDPPEPPDPPTPVETYVDCGCIYGQGSDNLFIELGSGYTTTTMKYRFVGKFLASAGGTHLGGHNLPETNDYRLFLSGTKTYLDMGNKRATGVLQAIQVGTAVDITVYDLGIIDNLQNTVILSGTSATTVPDVNFKINIGKLQVEALQFWETSGGTDTLVFNGVPKVRVADGQPGIYNTLDDTFYYTSEGVVNTCS